ncbi:MAG: hypothetical protein H7197_05300 [Vitreoscilla sp.]|nr:hypothetical protein [Polaromonas sp.]
MSKPEHPTKPADLPAQEGNAAKPDEVQWAQRTARDSSSFSSSIFGTEESLLGEASATRLDRLDAQSMFPGEQERPVWRTRWVRFVGRPWIATLFVIGLLRLALRRWIRHHPGLLSRSLETLLWPALFVFLCFISHPENPFYINEGFPWPWLGPWLIGLRYGVGYGAAAALGLLGSWALLAYQPNFPRLYFLGGAIATLIAGEFGSYWRMQMLRMQESLHFLNDKVERLTRRLYLVKLSHDELEYEMVDRPGTLRESLIELRVLMDQHTRENPLEEVGLPGAQFMLDFVVQHCRIQSAAMYSVRMEPSIELTRVAVAGRMRDPANDDPMVVRALESGYQVHLQDALMESAPSNQLIAATPLISSERQPFGLVAIGSMPFTALTTDNLQTIAVLVESYADYLRLSLNASEILSQWPDAPLGLAGEFAWLSRLFNEFGLASRCVVWRVRHAREKDMLDEILQLHSRGETAWRWPPDKNADSNKPCVIALVPFSDAGGVRIYKQRIFDSMDRSFGDLGVDQLNAFDFALGRENSFARLRWLVEGDPKDDAPGRAAVKPRAPKKAKK